MIRCFGFFVRASLIFYGLVACQLGSSAAPRRIVLIAGRITGHPKEAHEYEKNVILLKKLLESASNLREPLDVQAYFRGWPDDDRVLDRADSIYQSGAAPNHWFSKIQTWSGPVMLPSSTHPISRGVRPFTIQEEFYYQLRFRERDPRLAPIVSTRPPGEARSFPVGWAIERSDGGRGFGFTGGHFFKNWWNPDFRKLILNAVVWTAHGEVPVRGVETVLPPRSTCLIVTGHNHPAHDWRKTTAALILALEQDPRLDVSVTEDPEALANEKLFESQLVVLNYNNWDRPGLSPAAKTNFLTYLTKGGGLALIHFANGAFSSNAVPNAASDWPAFRDEIARRVWSNQSGHDAFGPFPVRVTPLSHPITAGLKDFETEDELYYRLAGALPIDPLIAAGSKVTHADEPMGWAYSFGAGKVVQTVLGHSDVSIRKAAAFIRRGAAWAAGLEPLGFDPPVQLMENALFREGSTWTIEQSLKRSTRPAQTNAPPEQRNPETKAQSLKRSAGKVNQLPPGPAANDPTLQTDADWIDDRWQQTDVGPFLSAAIDFPRQKVFKGISIKIGDKAQGAVCFDADTLRYAAGWSGGFLEMNARRYGLLLAPKPAGPIAFESLRGPGWSFGLGFVDPRSQPYGSLPREWGHYRGLFLHGNRVVLSYTAGDRGVLDSPWLEQRDGLTAFTRTLEFGPGSPLKGRVCQLGGARHGLVAGLRPDVEVVMGESNGMVTAAAMRRGAANLTIAPDGSALVELNDRHRAVVQVWIWHGPAEHLEKFARFAARSADPASLEPLTHGGPTRWTEPLETRGKVGPERGPFAIDTLTLPYSNPWKALLFVGGHDFFDNGDAAICTAHGDVWRVGGIDAKLEKLTWKRFATGLFQPLGLKIINNNVYVLGRDQITVLRDLDGDGEADAYENFNNDVFAAGGGHSFATCLETDPAGNFYFLKCAEETPHGGSLLRVSADGSRLDVVATGFRNPNGMGISPSGIITVADQQGEWVPETRLDVIRPGGFYGYVPMHHRTNRPATYDGPLCWIARSIDNSAGGEAWIPEGKWGPLSGKMVHLSYGRCSFMLVLPDERNNAAQAAIVPLPGRFLSGVMRARFNSRDDALYLSGLRGWQTAALRDGCLQRVRFVSKPFLRPVGFEVFPDGIRLRFPEPLDPGVAGDASNFSAEQWNFRWSERYGSADYLPSKPKEIGREAVEIKSVQVAPDGRAVFLQMPRLRPVMEMRIRYNLESAAGDTLRDEVYLTINNIETSEKSGRTSR